MSERFQTSQSKVKKWRQCHLCYHFKYVERLTRKVKSRPLQFGAIVHELLEAQLQKEDPFKLLDAIAKKQGKMFAAEREMYGDIIEDIRLIMECYFDYYKRDRVRPIKYRGQYAEHWLEVPVGGDLLFVMKIDWFAKTPNSLRWIGEHKTFSRAPGDDDRWRNLQSAVYIKGCELLDMPKFNGMLWNYVKSKAPKVPAVLKTGGLSIRDIDTLPAVVEGLIDELGLSREANQVLLDRATANVPNYFFRVYTPVTKRVVSILFRDFVDTSREIMECHGKKKDRNIGQHCGWCDYEPICRAQLTGADADFVKEREYEVGEKHEA